MAWNWKRRGTEEMGPWAFLTHNLSFALLTLAAVALLFAGRAQGSWTDAARSFLQDLVSPFFTAIAGPSNAASRWTEGLGGAFDVYGENQKLRDENAALLAFKNEAIELRQKVRRYEALLNAGPQPGTAFVTARVIADSGGAFQHTVLVGAGRDLGVARGQAVTNEHGLVGHVVNAGMRSSRVLMLNDIASRIPVRLERANVRAILAGDNGPQPFLDFLPRGSVLIAGDRVISASDGGVFPPGIPVGVVVQANGAPRVDLFADERRSDFVRVLRYEPPSDPASAPPEAMPGARRPPPQPPEQLGPPVIAGPVAPDPNAPMPAASPAEPADATAPVQSGDGAAAPVGAGQLLDDRPPPP